MLLKTHPLSSLGWGVFFQEQLTSEDVEQTIPYRVMAAHRGQLILSRGEEEVSLSLTRKMLQEQGMAQITVGDWLLISRKDSTFVRLLNRVSLIQRQSAGAEKSQQMVAANVDTLFIVTSCNDDFNLSRLERYLAIAYAAEVHPVIVLTKQDLSDNPQQYVTKAQALGPRVLVELVNAKAPSTLQGLRDWCKPGQTIALVGSSGVGKSTLVNVLGAKHQKTGDIREGDAKGRHTTTHRSLLPLSNGAVLLDCPGMRGLGMTDSSGGVSIAFEDIENLSRQCRFSDCQHDKEPGCAVKEALNNQELSQRRMSNYTKLMAEQNHNTASTAELRKKGKATVKSHNKVKSQKKLNQGH